jgi:hypothetical protein
LRDVRVSHPDGVRVAKPMRREAPTDFATATAGNVHLRSIRSDARFTAHWG